ncbi:hypothetical protein HGA92_04320 [Candidatus Gracilibacteria bacterium]|nr:hypothetical protein [Candidatus Gracilibacteria bacterium]NUJ98540.1 hypothetical protein [Candidatus Gracilibacteria bacterium]
MKKRQKRILRHIFRNTQILLASIAVIMVWRGVWNFLDYYIFPESFFVSNFISIILGGLIIFFNDFDIEELKGQ